MKKVSIIIPIYNCEEYLDACLISALNQDYDNYEIIAINDGSTDKSMLILEKYKNDNKLIIINKKNEGVSKTRNLGIQKAKGNYICFCDSDDILERNYISSLVRNIKCKDELVVGKYRIIGKEENNNCVEFEDTITFTKNNVDKITELYDKTVLQAPYCKLFNLDIIKNNKILFNEEINFGEDSIFVLNYIEIVKKISTFNGVIYNYRINPNGLTKKITSRQVISFEKYRSFLSNIIKKHGFIHTKLDEYNIKSTLIDYFNFNLIGFDSWTFRNDYKKLKKSSLIRTTKKRYRKNIKEPKIMMFYLFDFSIIWFILSKIIKVKNKRRRI